MHLFFPEARYFQKGGELCECLLQSSVQYSSVTAIHKYLLMKHSEQCVKEGKSLQLGESKGSAIHTTFFVLKYRINIHDYVTSLWRNAYDCVCAVRTFNYFLFKFSVNDTHCTVRIPWNIKINHRLL